MQSKTSCSNMSLFRRCLRRYWPVTFAVLVVLVFWMGFPLANRLSSGQLYESLSPAALRDSARNLVLWNTQLLPVYTGLFALAAAMAAFEHVYSARLTGLFASLPVRREKIFSQHWLAGAWMLLAPGIVMSLALLAIEAVYGAIDPLSAFSWLGAYVMESLTFYGVAVFCVMLTGHVLVIPALYLLVNFAASALNLMISGLVQSYTYGIVNGMESFGWMHTFSPFVRLSTEVAPKYVSESQIVGLEGWGWIFGYFVVGLLLSVCALLLFKKRHNERAQETTAFGVLRPLLKYIVTVFFALGLPFLVLFFLGGFRFYSGDAAGTRFFALHLLLTAVGAVIGYFLSEMIIHKSIRVSTGKGWAKALLVGLLCCGVIGLFRLDVFGIAKRVPAAETVQTIELYVQDQEYNVSTPEGIEAIEDLHREIIARRDETAQLYETAEYRTYLHLTYVLQDGSVLQRGYAIPDCALLDLAEDTLNAPAVQSGLKELNPPAPVDKAHLTEGYISYPAENADYENGMNLTTAEALALYEEAIRPDVEAGHYGKADLRYDEAEYNRTHYGVRICLSLKINELGGTSLNYEPTSETTFTNAWLEAHGIELVPLADRAGG